MYSVVPVSGYSVRWISRVVIAEREKEFKKFWNKKGADIRLPLFTAACYLFSVT